MRHEVPSGIVAGGVPSGVALALFASLATWVIARYGRRQHGNEN